MVPMIETPSARSGLNLFPGRSAPTSSSSNPAETLLPTGCPIYSVLSFGPESLTPGTSATDMATTPLFGTSVGNVALGGKFCAGAATTPENTWFQTPPGKGRAVSHVPWPYRSPFISFVS
jgi:hypothetical protein